MDTWDFRLRQAVRHFWATRAKQSRRQGSANRTRDRGQRTAVTGGKQMDGFVRLVKHLLVQAGIPESVIHCRRHAEIPGYFRPEKQWDLLVVPDGNLLASIEFKSQVGPSFGNNYNNRAEEALGSATDLWTAYREGAFRFSLRPWVGYFMLLEESPGSTSPVSVHEPHFPVFDEFRGASYARRYEILLTKLVRERLYDAACLLLSDQRTGPRGDYREPTGELGFRNFASSLLGKANGFISAFR